MKKPDIKYLFEPRSVAVVGASHDPGKIGFKVLDNIIKSGFRGKIYPINPKGGEILGQKVYKSVADVPGEIDIADICIPARFVLDSVKECADNGVKFAPIITSGFSEVGNIEVEKEMVSYANKKGMRILGPNIFGVYSSSASINATFGPDKIQKGGVAIVTQSGALGLSMIGKTAVENIGLSAIVSVGNKADISEYEILDYLKEQDETRTILMYIEGVKDGERLVDVLKKTTKKKPVIVIKSGRSERGAIAVASHTGSLAGSDRVFDDIMRQCGVLRADTIEDAFNWCKFFDSSAISKGKNTAIITNGGGIGVMAADACEAYDVQLYSDSQDLKKTFSDVTPDFGSTKNPIDVTGGATSKEYDMALKAALKNKNIDSVIALYCETAVFDAENLTSLIDESYKSYRRGGKPLVFSIFGGEAIENSIVELRRKGIPVFDDVYQGVSSLGAMEYYRRYGENYTTETAEAKIDVGKIDEIAKSALNDGRSFLLAHEGQRVMDIANVQIPKSRIAHNIDQAVSHAEEIGYPVVMKVVSKDILHKSDVGGVVLNLSNKDEVVDAYQAIMSACKSYKPNANIEGVEIAEMVHSGTEIIVGARKDPAFGPTIMCGMGGIYVEVMKDIAFRSVPLNRKEIMSMIKEIKSYQILLGVRGEDKKDINALVDTIIKVANIIRKSRYISDIEVNPVAVYEQGKGIRAVDVRILLSKNSKTNGDKKDE
jgi:acetyltransferase